jgi:hypothetical protein
MDQIDFTRFGPFAAVVGIALALVATFSMLLLKMFGGIARWTWLASGAPSFLVTAGARILAVALMAVTYVTITKSNYRWFGAVAVVCGLLGFITIAKFDRVRRRHVMQIPEVGPDGKQLTDDKNRSVARSVVRGLEENMSEPAKAEWIAARKRDPSLSLAKFMAGFGANPNDPEALWDPALLADIGNSLTVTLMSAFLFGVMVLFISAFIIEVFRTK